MIESHGYETYRVRLRRRAYGFIPLAILWNRRVVQFRWTEYSRAHVEKHFGHDWPIQLSMASDKSRYWIQGRVGEDEWQELSQWRLDELRRADDDARARARYVLPAEPTTVAVGVVVPLAVSTQVNTQVEVTSVEPASTSTDDRQEEVPAGKPIPPAEQMRRAYAAAVQKPGVGEAVFHAMDHLGLGADQTEELINGLGIWSEVHRKKIARYRKNGARRVRIGDPCRFCPS